MRLLKSTLLRHLKFWLQVKRGVLLAACSNLSPALDGVCAQTTACLHVVSAPFCEICLAHISLVIIIIIFVKG